MCGNAASESRYQPYTRWFREWPWKSDEKGREAISGFPHVIERGTRVQTVYASSDSRAKEKIVRWKTRDKETREHPQVARDLHTSAIALLERARGVVCRMLRAQSRCHASLENLPFPLFNIGFLRAILKSPRFFPSHFPFFHSPIFLSSPRGLKLKGGYTHTARTGLFARGETLKRGYEGIPRGFRSAKTAHVPIPPSPYSPFNSLVENTGWKIAEWIKAMASKVPRTAPK